MTKLLNVGIQMVLMTSSILAAAIQVAINLSFKISAQAIESPDSIAEITVVIASISVVIPAVASVISIPSVIPVTDGMEITDATAGMTTDMDAMTTVISAILSGDSIA